MSIRTQARMLAATASLAIASAASIAVAATAHAEAAAVAAPGMAIFQKVGDGNVRCTLGFTARNAHGDRLAVTAGHCGSTGAVVTDLQGRTIGRYVATAPDDYNAHRYGYAIMALADGVDATNKITPSVPIDRPSAGLPGDQVCLFGTTSGAKCGTITKASNRVGVIAGFLSQHGDSGGPIIRPRDNALVGILVAHDTAAGETYYQPLATLEILAYASRSPIGDHLGPIVTYPPTPLERSA